MSSSSSLGPMTKAWAAYVAGFKSSDVPAPVRARALQMILDGSGALLAAANPKISTGRLIADFVGDLGGKAEASIVGHGFKTSVVNAALANGTMGYTCDVEPHHPEGVLHPIAVMTPTALAISEKTGASGADFVAAVILGCEIEYRLSMALGPVEQYNLGFHPSAVCGCFGATAAAAFLLGLDESQVTKAFGLAGCQASGLMAWESDETENSRPFQMGMAARNGVTSAMLAKRGFGGPINIFDSGHTVFGAFSRKSAPQHMTKDLGTAYDGIMELAIKPYSSVSFLHPALDLLLDIARKEKLAIEDVASITLRFPSSGTHCIDNNPLKSHCAQYILPVALSREGLSCPRPVQRSPQDRQGSGAALRPCCRREGRRPGQGLPQFLRDHHRGEGAERQNLFRPQRHRPRLSGSAAVGSRRAGKIRQAGGNSRSTRPGRQPRCLHQRPVERHPT